MSDDEKENFDAWKEAAFEEGIELECHDNWEDAQSELGANWDKYDFLILDGRGKMMNEGNIENAQHVIKPIHWLSEMKGKGQIIPAAVYTAYWEELQDIVTVNNIVVGIHDKGKVQFSDLCINIKGYLTANPDYKLKAAYPELFELFALKLLKDEYRANIVDMLRFIRGEYSGNTIDVFRGIRPILENTLVEMYRFDKGLIDQKYFSKGAPEISGIIWYLAGSKKKDSTGKLISDSPETMPDYAYKLASRLQVDTSSSAMHHSDDKTNKYMVASAINALFAYLTWYLDFVKTYYIK